MNPSKRYLDTFLSLLIPDVKEYFRVPLIVLSSSLLPVTMTLAFGLGLQMGGGQDGLFGEHYFDFLLPGIVAVGVLFSSVNAGGYVAILDRQKQVIRDLIISPVPYTVYILARLCGVVVKCSVQNLATIAVGLYFMEGAQLNPLVYLLNYVLSVALFGALGMLLGSISGILTFPGVSSIALLPPMYLCGVFFPVSNFGQGKWALLLHPFTLTVDLFRAALTGAPLLMPALAGMLTLMVFALGSVALWISVFSRKVRLMA